MRPTVLAAAFAALTAAAATACNNPSDTDATTIMKTTPGNLPLAPSASVTPANPRGVTMKGTPPGAQVAGETPALPDGGVAPPLR